MRCAVWRTACGAKGLRWRDDPVLRVRCFWLLLYVHNSTKVNKVYFDDVVLSREYIGPKK